MSPLQIGRILWQLLQQMQGGRTIAGIEACATGSPTMAGLLFVGQASLQAEIVDSLRIVRRHGGRRLSISEIAILNRTLLWRIAVFVEPRFPALHGPIPSHKRKKPGSGLPPGWTPHG